MGGMNLVSSVWGKQSEHVRQIFNLDKENWEPRWFKNRY